MTHTAKSGLLAGLLAAGSALGATGCGVPAREAPVTVRPSAVPYGLLSETPATASREPDSTPAATSPRAFFITSADRLVGVPLDPPPATSPLTAAITALSAGPDRLSRSRGLSTAIPPGLALAVTRVQNRTAVIDVGGEPAPGGDQGPLAVAQIVLTATSVRTVHRVLLTRHGQPLEAQLPDGALTSAPLTARHYKALLVPPPP